MPATSSAFTVACGRQDQRLSLRHFQLCTPSVFHLQPGRQVLDVASSIEAGSVKVGKNRERATISVLDESSGVFSNTYVLVGQSRPEKR